MTNALRYEVVESRKTPGEWRAEAIDTEGDGDVYVVLFAGPQAQERAEEYAAWKNSDQQAELSTQR